MNTKSMTVREIATLANVVPEVVRYYSRISLIKPKKNRNNGYNLYNDNDVSRIIFIRKAKSLGFTLKEIKKILSHAMSSTSPCPMVRRIIENRVEENRQRLDDMLALQVRMEKAVQHWKGLPDGMPDGHSVCVLIESFTREMG